MMEWKIQSGSPKTNLPKLPYVGTWAHFSKLSEDEKSKVFNAMRGALISSELMENKGG